MINNKFLNRIASVKGDRKKVDAILAECKSQVKSDPSALVALSVMQLEGIYLEKNISSALKRLDSIVKESNNPEASEVMAIIYEKGLFGQQSDIKKSERFYRISANAERPEASFKLATFYESHPQFTPDLAESFRWYEVAAKAGHTTALEKLGAIYLTGGTGLFGDHIGKEESKGIQLLETATEKGSKDAAKRLSLFHLGKLIQFANKSSSEDKSIELILSNMADIEWLSK
ncbi:tetratricopeptide repeat protein [Vibrio crassostreae]|uniref:tetratricopeptide repeat protein n=1 Tax=Vibrio crassostreae TaxID=246167 RepID=UPI001B31524E|nr:tetratricopeptide repeat protein [Vibrio crassostreae]